MSKMTNKEFKNLLTEWISNFINEGESEANLKNEREKLEFIKNANVKNQEHISVLARLAKDRSGEVRREAVSKQTLNAEQLAEYFSDEKNETRDLVAAFTSNRGNFNTAVLDKIFDAARNTKNIGRLANVFAAHEEVSEDILDALSDMGIKHKNNVLLRVVKGNRNCPSDLKKKIAKYL